MLTLNCYMCGGEVTRCFNKKAICFKCKLRKNRERTKLYYHLHYGANRNDAGSASRTQTEAGR